MDVHLGRQMHLKRGVLPRLMTPETTLLEKAILVTAQLIAPATQVEQIAPNYQIQKQLMINKLLDKYLTGKSHKNIQLGISYRNTKNTGKGSNFYHSNN